MTTTLAECSTKVNELANTHTQNFSKLRLGEDKNSVHGVTCSCKALWVMMGFHDTSVVEETILHS